MESPFEFRSSIDLPTNAFPVSDVSIYISSNFPDKFTPQDQVKRNLSAQLSPELTRFEKRLALRKFSESV